MSHKVQLTNRYEQELEALLNDAAESVSEINLIELRSELDNRVALSNDSFLNEVKNLSLISVTAAPFSLTLLLSGLEIEKTFLVIAFLFLMANVLFINVGLWYLNAEFRKLTGAQRLEEIQISLSGENIRNRRLDASSRLDSLNNLIESQDRLKNKKIAEPDNQEKILGSLRDWGLVLLSEGILFLILSVFWAILPIR
jgi:hypothetical protein